MSIVAEIKSKGQSASLAARPENERFICYQEVYRQFQPKVKPMMQGAPKVSPNSSATKGASSKQANTGARGSSKQGAENQMSQQNKPTAKRV